MAETFNQCVEVCLCVVALYRGAHELVPIPFDQRHLDMEFFE